MAALFFFFFFFFLKRSRKTFLLSCIKYLIITSFLIPLVRVVVIVMLLVLLLLLFAICPSFVLLSSEQVCKQILSQNVLSMAQGVFPRYSTSKMNGDYDKILKSYFQRAKFLHTKKKFIKKIIVIKIFLIWIFPNNLMHGMMNL